MTALVTGNLPLVSGAPNGIEKLRDLILVLAVRGRLVPHDPSDEPASELLKRTADARTQRPRRGKARNPASGAEEDWPHAIPAGWQWCRLADLVEVLNGRAYKKEELLDAGTPVLRVGNLFTSNHWYYSDLELDADRYCLPGDLLYAWSASFGPFIWSGDRAIYHYHIWKLEPHSHADLNRLYLHTYLAERTKAIKAAGHGVSMTHMTKEKMERIAVPLPPLAEQARIVAKVDELMALCDRLEAEQADAEAAHAKLVEALLASLTQARDAADFRASWQQLAEHFHTLFTTEASIDALKQTVMQLGVSGRLTACDQSVADAPKCSVAKPLWDTAHGWIWRTLGEVLESGIQNGISPKAASAETPVRCLTLSATTRGKFNASCFKYVDLDEEVAGKYRLQPGDLLVQRANSIDYVGVSAVYDGDDGAFIFPDLMMRMRAGKLVSIEFLHLCLAVEPSRAYMRANATGTQGNMPKVNQGTVSRIPVPVPPLESQHRIVSKVNEILALCDQLRSSIAAARAQHAQLAEALVKQAVAA